MNKQTFLTALAIFSIATVSCQKKPEAPAGSPQPSGGPSKIEARYGFAVHAPKEVASYLAFYGLKKLWFDVKNSKSAAVLFADPTIQKTLAGLSLTGTGADGNRQIKTLRPLLGNLFGEEAFLMLAPGSDALLKPILDFSNALRAEQFRSSLTRFQHPEKNGQLGAYLAIYAAHAEALQVPPVIFGGKAQKSAVAEQIALLETQLPVGVEAVPFNLDGNLPFKSLVFSMAKLLPTARQEQIRKIIGSKTPDSKAADALFRSIMARRIELAYGFIGDYFVVSVGKDHSHLKLANGFGDSLMARPEMGIASQFADKELLSFSWCNKSLSALSLPDYKALPYYNRLKSELAALLPAADATKLALDLARIDGKGAKVFPCEVDPSVGFAYRDHGICTESFGGIKLQGFSRAQSLKFSAVPPASTFLWIDGQRDALASAALWDWVEDITSTGYDLLVSVGVPKLPDQQRMAFGMFQNLALPKLTELYRITRDQLGKSLGNESAFAVDLGGEMPQFPLIPELIQKNGKMPRLGIVREVADRKLLGQSWSSYLKMARDIALMIPQTSKIPGGLPAPNSEVADGVTLSYYPTPTGDLLPNAATTETTLVMSTSRNFSVELSKAAAKPLPAGQKPLAIELRVNPAAACDFLDSWMALASADPSLMFPKKAASAEAFVKKLPVFTAVIKSARAVTGIEYKVYEENGLRRVSTRVGWKN